MVLSGPPPLAHASPPDSPKSSIAACVLQRIEAQLVHKYKGDEGAELPAQVRIEFGDESPQSLFEIFHEVWKAGEGNFLAQRQLVEKVAAGTALTRDELAAFKLTRSRFKELRFAFIGFDKHHEAPKHLGALTIGMGKIQDALALDPPEKGRMTAQSFAKDLLKPWSRHGLRKVKAEIDGFHAVSKKGFYRWIGSQLDELETILNADALTEKEFHLGRKILSCQTAVFFELNAAHPSEELAADLAYLSDWTSKVGDLHDIMVKEELTGKKVGSISYPPALKQKALAYINALRASLSGGN